MKKVITLLLSFLLLSFGFLFLAPSRLSSSRVKNTYLYYSSAYGQGYDVDFMEDTSLQVTEEKISYDIHTNTKSTYSIEYTIANPTENDITTQVAFPFKCPISTYTSDEDLVSSQYSLQVDGKKLEPKLNHFYLDGNKTTFDIPDFSEEYLKDDVYTPDYPIYERCFKFTSQEYNLFNVTFTLPEETKLSKYAWNDFVDNSLFTENDITYRTYTNTIHSEGMIWVYFMGKDDTSHFLEQLTFSTDNIEKKKISVTTSIVNENCEDYTLQELIDSHFPKSSHISKVDWYNATIQKLKENTSWNQSLDFFNLNDELMGCYQYSLTVPKQSQITHIIDGPAAMEITSSSYSYHYNFMFNFSDSKPYEYINQFSLSLLTNATLYDTYNFKRSNIIFDENNGESYVLKTTARPERYIGFEVYYAANSFAGLFAGILLIASFVFEVLLTSFFLFLLIFYLVAYFKDKRYYSGKNKQNLTLLLVEGLLSAISLPILAFFIILSNSLLFPAIISISLSVISLIIDLIRHILIKDKIYLPIIFIAISIAFASFFIIGRLSLWGLALIYVFIYSLYYFISFILAKQKAMREAN